MIQSKICVIETQIYKQKIITSFISVLKRRNNVIQHIISNKHLLTNNNKSIVYFCLDFDSFDNL